MNTIKVQAIRTHCRTDVPREVTVEIERKYHASNLNSWWIKIIHGGVTGYESMTEDCVKEMTDGWWACAGTKNRWDSLFISREEMQKIAEWIEKEKQLSGPGRNLATP